MPHSETYTDVYIIKILPMRASDDGEVVPVDRGLKMSVLVETWNQGGTNSHDPLTFLHTRLNHFRQH